MAARALTLAFLLAAGLAIFASMRTTPQLEPEVATRGAPATSNSGAPSGAESNVESNVSRRKTQRTAQETSSAPAAGAAAHAALVPCAVFGLVRSTDGIPIANAKVQLGSYEPWDHLDRDVGATQFSAPSGHGRKATKLFGFETTTDQHGRFRIETSVPATPKVDLWIRPDPFHQIAHRRFRRGLHYEAKLKAGERDLGIIELGAAGAMRGRVNDENGVGVEGAHVDFANDGRTRVGESTVTSADGRYLIRHMPAGTYTLRVTKSGFVPVRRADATVELGKVTRNANVQLQRSTYISGIVVDQAGEPVADVAIEGHALPRRGMATARSGTDGTFSLELFKKKRHYLVAGRKGYLRWGGRQDEASHFEPGTNDVRIQLTALAPTTFLVLDGTTREPITAFGVELQVGIGPRSPMGSYVAHVPARPEEHAVIERPRGLVTLEGLPKEDQVVIHAPDYPPTSTTFVAPNPDGSPVEIRLDKGCGVRGRILYRGLPLAGASVVAAATAHRGRFVRVLRATRRWCVTSTDGSFSIVGLPAGTGQVALDVQDGEHAGVTCKLENLTFHADRVLDLGDIQCSAPGQIEGVILGPPGVDVSGLAVSLSSRASNQRTTTDQDGAFRFEGLPAGEVGLTQEGRDGVLLPSKSVRVSVRSGETSYATLDVRAYGLTTVELAITIDCFDSPKGLWVELVEAEPTSKEPLRFPLGIVGKDGRVKNTGPAFGPALIKVFGRGMPRVTHPTETLDLRFGENVTRAIRFESAAVSFTLPDSVDVPDTGFLKLRLEPSEAPSKGTSTRVELEDGQPVGFTAKFFEREGRTWRVRALPPGSFKASITGHTVAPQAGNENEVGAQRRPSQEPVFLLRGSVALRAGQSVRMALD